MYENLLQKANDLVTSGVKAELQWYEVRPFGITELDEAIFEVCFKEFKKLGLKFRFSKESRYKDKKVHTWKDLYFKKQFRGGGYTVQRVVFRDPDYSVKTGKYDIDIFSDIMYQADLIDSWSGRVENISCGSMLELCGKVLERAKEFFSVSY